VGDAVQGNAGSLPPDQIVSTPIASVLVYDGPWEAGNPLGQTDANGDFTATLTLGVHSIGVMMITTDDSMFASDGNVVTVTSTPGNLVIHVIPDTVALQIAYDTGVGNAIYVTGETSALGGWTTAYKAAYNTSSGQWQFTSHLPAGAQYKLLFAPWTDASSIPVSSAGVKWETGDNRVVPASYYSVLNLDPSF
jgi:Starch binding domain